MYVLVWLVWLVRLNSWLGEHVCVDQHIRKNVFIRIHTHTHTRMHVCPHRSCHRSDWDRCAQAADRCAAEEEAKCDEAPEWAVLQQRLRQGQGGCTWTYMCVCVCTTVKLWIYMCISHFGCRCGCLALMVLSTTKSPHTYIRIHMFMYTHLQSSLHSCIQSCMHRWSKPCTRSETTTAGWCTTAIPATRWSSTSRGTSIQRRSTPTPSTASPSTKVGRTTKKGIYQEVLKNGNMKKYVYMHTVSYVFVAKSTNVYVWGRSIFALWPFKARPCRRDASTPLSSFDRTG